MNDCVSRATALIDVFAAGEQVANKQPFAEAALTCCTDLIQSGEPERAVKLCEAALRAYPDHVSEWGTRLRVVQARALMAAARFGESLALIAKIQATVR